MRTLVSEGHTVFLVCPVSAEDSAEAENVYTIGPVRPLYSYPSYTVVEKPLTTAMRVKNILNMEKPDVIHSNTPLTIGFAALCASRSLGIPLIGSLHTLLPELVRHYPPLRMKQLGEVLGWQIYNHYYNLCDYVTCPTPTMRRILLRRAIRRKIMIAPNGVDIDRFKPSKRLREKFRERLGLSNRNKVVMFSGRLSFEKSVEVLILAFKRLIRCEPEAILLILGGGPQEYPLIRLVKEIGIEKHVFFLGRIKHNDKLIPEIYNASDVFVLPSAFETQGLSVLEAMACGKTVIATNTGGVVDMIEDKKSGILVRFNDIHELTNALRNTLMDDQKRLQIGKIARKTAETYSLRLTTRKLIEIYKLLLTSQETRERMPLGDIANFLLYSSAFFSSFALFHILQSLRMT